MIQEHLSEVYRRIQVQEGDLRLRLAPFSHFRTILTNTYLLKTILSSSVIFLCTCSLDQIVAGVHVYLLVCQMLFALPLFLSKAMENSILGPDEDERSAPAIYPVQNCIFTVSIIFF